MMTRPRIALNIQGEQMLICQDCGVMFFSIDANRKYCDLHLVERVNGAGILEDDEPDSLFTLHQNVCDRCGAQFSTGRRSRFCAICAGPRARVQCPVCDITHEVPILAEHKLCKSCSVDLPMTLNMARARYDDARAAFVSSYERLMADYAHATPEIQARYDTAVGLKLHGTLEGRALAPNVAQAAWEKAKERQDGLSPLLALYDDVAALDLAQRRAESAVEAAALAQPRAGEEGSHATA